MPYYLANSNTVDCQVVNGAATGYRMGPDGTPAQTYAPGETIYNATRFKEPVLIGALMVGAAFVSRP